MSVRELGSRSRANGAKLVVDHFLTGWRLMKKKKVGITNPHVLPQVPVRGAPARAAPGRRLRLDLQVQRTGCEPPHCDFRTWGTRFSGVGNPHTAIFGCGKPSTLRVSGSERPKIRYLFVFFIITLKPRVE